MSSNNSNKQANKPKQTSKTTNKQTTTTKQATPSHPLPPHPPKKEAGDWCLTHGTQHPGVLLVSAVVMAPAVLVDAAVHQVLLAARAADLVQQDQLAAVASLGVGNGASARPDTQQDRQSVHTQQVQSSVHMQQDQSSVHTQQDQSSVHTQQDQW